MEMEPDACLVASELVTNGLRHGGGAESITLTANNRHLQIAVADKAAFRSPRRLYRELTAEGGRGIALVEAVADTWGTTRPEGAPRQSRLVPVEDLNGSSGGVGEPICRAGAPQAEWATDGRRRRRRANPLAGDEDSIETSWRAQHSELLYIDSRTSQPSWAQTRFVP